MTVLPHNPHRIRTLTQQHTLFACKVLHKRAIWHTCVRTDTCALTSAHGGLRRARQSGDQYVIKISVVSFSYFPYRFSFSVRHKIVHSSLRLAPHLRRHIREGRLINKSNHYNQWPQSLQSSLASTL